MADHIALDDWDAARRLVQRVFKKVDLLEDNPQLGSISKELRTTPYRKLIIKPIYVYYRIENDQVIV
ncbi:MAG: type II toxin-antitoxin system RelE/ParE family toxin, partial [Vibrio sp.]|nr:type II toxin-antitoxin system RelE/ParE family toxin [Vibrio sp.]